VFCNEGCRNESLFWNFRILLRLPQLLFGKPYLHRSFAEPKKHLLRSSDSLPITHVSIRDSLQIVCLRIAVLFVLVSIWFSTVKWSKQKVLTGDNISWGRLALRYWRYEVHWLIRCTKSTALRLIIRTMKHDARNISYSSRWQFRYVWIESFLELSRRQNWKTIELWKEQFFLISLFRP